jgi:hypothetical protein
MALPPPPSYHPVIDFGPATPWPTKPTPNVRAKRQPGDLVWRLHCPTCNADWAQSRRPSEGTYCAACFRSRKTKPRLLIKWLGPGPMPAKRKPAAIKWRLSCSVCAMTYLRSRRPKAGLICGKCYPSTRSVLVLSAYGSVPGS